MATRNKTSPEQDAVVRSGEGSENNKDTEARKMHTGGDARGKDVGMTEEKMEELEENVAIACSKTEEEDKDRKGHLKNGKEKLQPDVGRCEDEKEGRLKVGHLGDDNEIQIVAEKEVKHFGEEESCEDNTEEAGEGDESYREKVRGVMKQDDTLIGYSMEDSFEENMKEVVEDNETHKKGKDVFKRDTTLVGTSEEDELQIQDNEEYVERWGKEQASSDGDGGNGDDDGGCGIIKGDDDVSVYQVVEGNEDDYDNDVVVNNANIVTRDGIYDDNGDAAVVNAGSDEEDVVKSDVRGAYDDRSDDASLHGDHEDDVTNDTDDADKNVDGAKEDENINKDADKDKNWVGVKEEDDNDNKDADKEKNWDGVKEDEDNKDADKDKNWDGVKEDEDNKDADKDKNWDGVKEDEDNKDVDDDADDAHNDGVDVINNENYDNVDDDSKETDDREDVDGIVFNNTSENIGDHVDDVNKLQQKILTDGKVDVDSRKIIHRRHVLKRQEREEVVSFKSKSNDDGETKMVDMSEEQKETKMANMSGKENKMADMAKEEKEAKMTDKFKEEKETTEGHNTPVEENVNLNMESERCESENDEIVSFNSKSSHESEENKMADMSGREGKDVDSNGDFRCVKENMKPEEEFEQYKSNERDISKENSSDSTWHSENEADDDKVKKNVENQNESKSNDDDDNKNEVLDTMEKEKEFQNKHEDGHVKHVKENINTKGELERFDKEEDNSQEMSSDSTVHDGRQSDQ